MLKDFICELEAQVEQWAHNKFIDIIEGNREELVGRLQAKDTTPVVKRQSRSADSVPQVS
jgi:Mg2+/Co2+ transporter CorC